MTISDPDQLLETLADLNYQQLRYELTKLRAVRDWALDHVGIDYAVGDHVRIKADWRLGEGSGWRPYREALTPGAGATVNRIDFNEAHGYWYADIVLDREWSVALKSDGASPDRRWWHGPAGETPEGMEPPTKSDQERHPQGRKHTFMFPATALEKAEGQRDA